MTVGIRAQLAACSSPRDGRLRFIALGLVAIAVLACGDDADPSDSPVALTIVGVPATSAPGATLTGLHLEAERGGEPAAGIEVTVAVLAGGGSAPATLTTDAKGSATFDWTVGLLPIENALSVEVGLSGSMTATLDVTTGGALTSNALGDVDAFLARNDVDGSTEDLAFGPDGQLVMGVPGHLITVTRDGAVAFLPTTGEPLLRPLGLAFDGQGRLWIADGEADALMVRGPDGAVRNVLGSDGDVAFEAPNDVAVGPDGRVYMSDTCTGKVYMIDPDTGAVLDRIGFDHVAEGGPNGLVVGPGAPPELWVTTENTALFCGDQDVQVTAPVAGLFKVALEARGFGARTTVAAAVAVFGDGLAFDHAGNLYVLFDTAVGFALDETIVQVLPRGGTALRRGFAAKDKVWANLAFGVAPFDETTMYLSLLRLPPFTQTRGVEAVRVGVGGAPLPSE